MRIEASVYLPKAAPRLERGEAGLPEALPKDLPASAQKNSSPALPSVSAASFKEQPMRQAPHSYPQTLPQGRVGQALASYASTANLPLDELASSVTGLDLYA